MQTMPFFQIKIGLISFKIIVALFVLVSFAIFIDTIEIYKVMFNYFAVEYFAMEERVVLK